MSHWKMLAKLPLIFIDCVGNVLVGESFCNTLSATAWRKRDHKHWSWTHRFIDRLFYWQAHHCKTQDRRETKHGSVWGSWRADYQALPGSPFRSGA